jgi:hypothetical protein
MNNDKLAQFANQKYLNLETYRKSGKPVPTPVWFAEDNGVLYVYSNASTGKVKRIRNNPRVRIVPCDARGGPKGEWIEAQARLVDDVEGQRGHQLLNRKYGWQKKLIDFFSGFKKSQQVVIAIHV